MLNVQIYFHESTRRETKYVVYNTFDHEKINDNQDLESTIWTQLHAYEL